MRNIASLSTKLVRIGAALLVVALVSIGLTLWVTWQLGGGAAALNEAGRMRMQTWRLTSTVQAQMNEAEVHLLVKQFDDSIELLRNGDSSRPLFVPWSPVVPARPVVVFGCRSPPPPPTPPPHPTPCLPLPLISNPMASS